MKKNTIFKILSYILLSISITTLILSILCIGLKNSVYYNEEKYFSSDIFVGDYINTLSNIANVLIHDKENYTCKQDGETKIYYLYNYYNKGVKINNTDINEMYFLIIYKNQAITNVSEDTIASIKQYINENKETKKVSIIDGKIATESEAMKQYGSKYLDSFSFLYYTTDTQRTDKQLSDGRYIEYVYPKVQDFEIYSSYKEKLDINSERQIMNKFVGKTVQFEKIAYVIFPISIAVTILLLLYLIITIGRKDEKGKIELNDFDKIPLEIIIFFSVIISGVPFIPLMSEEIDYNMVVSTGITIYLTIYILTVIVLNTIIKRIKSKTLYETTIIGKIIKLIIKLGKKAANRCKNIWNTLIYSPKTTIKTITIIGILAIFWTIVIMLFYGSGFLPLVIIALIISAIYGAVRITKEYSQIERKLKEITEGNNQNELDEKGFIPYFQTTIKYLNDISGGFEKAIQERMKSEKLKTELITNVSHDIKTPLTSIINYTDLLKKENIENEKAKEYINILDNKSQRLKKLTEDLVEASKISTGNVTLNLEKINIVELTKQALGEFEDRFNKKGLQVIMDSEKNNFQILADSRYMYRIIENLFSNISKYAMENSRVYIDIKNKENKVYLELKNISKDKLNISAEELMQRFVRGDKSRTTEGSGLGLSIAQNLTELQKGKFKLKLDGDLFKVELIFDTI